MSILMVLVGFFILLGVALPFIQDSFGQSQTSVGVQGFENDLGDNVENSSQISIFTVLFSVLKMFFWTFGDLPVMLDAILLVFRVMLVLIIARNVWIGGGA